MQSKASKSRSIKADAEDAETKKMKEANTDDGAVLDDDDDVEVNLGDDVLEDDEDDNVPLDEIADVAASDDDS